MTGGGFFMAMRRPAKASAALSEQARLCLMPSGSLASSPWWL